MDKIYSRFRLPRIVGVSTKLDNRKKFLIIVIIIIFISYFTAIKLIDNTITPLLERQSRVLARGVAAKLSNNAASNAMKDMTYQDLCTIEKDSNGNVKLMKLDVANMNKICSSVALEIQDGLDKAENTSFNLRLGTITGNKFFIGKGPNIGLTMVTVGNIETNIKSEFSEAGINQTLHRIYIDITCHISILTPYKDSDEDVNTQVLLAEAVIVGNIPDTYYNLNGMSEGDTLNVLQ